MTKKFWEKVEDVLKVSPSGAKHDGKLVLTFDPVPDEAQLNWRQQSRVSEVWLLRD